MLFHPMSWGTQELLLLAVIILIVLQAIILRRLLAPSPPPSLPPPTRPPLTPLPLPPVLPRPRPEEAEDESPSSSPRPLRYRAPPQAPYQVVTGQGSVLVVDDNEINQLLFRKMLQRYKFQVDIAADGEQALMRLRAKPYAAVFLDLGPPPSPPRPPSGPPHPPHPSQPCLSWTGLRRLG